MKNRLDDLQHITQSLDTTHLSHALDLYLMAKSQIGQTGWSNRILVHRLSLSCIIHAFSGLEAAINYLAYEYFINSDSARFIPDTKRDFLLKKLVKSWDISPSIEKLTFLLHYSSNTQLSPNLECRLRELNNLRNWIAHGFSYKTTLLIEVDEENTSHGTVVDLEESVNWRNKFPNTKFGPLHELGIADAYTSCKIVFEVLKMLSSSTKQPFSLLLTSSSKNPYKILFEDSFDMDKLLQDQ